MIAGGEFLCIETAETPACFSGLSTAGKYLDNTAEGESSIVAEVDRYAAVPGQATSYLLGSLEIQRLRRRAETALGNRFDIRDFHHRILGNGAVTLPMLGAAVGPRLDVDVASLSRLSYWVFGPAFVFAVLAER